MVTCAKNFGVEGDGDGHPKPSPAALTTGPELVSEVVGLEAGTGLGFPQAVASTPIQD